MYSKVPFALAVLWGALLHPAQGIAQPRCQPEISVSKSSFSEAINLTRYWTASLDVDASRCAETSGLFSLGFVRGSESARDLEFTEPFIWKQGQMTVRVAFWWDEAIDRYWIADIAACSCRSK
jgi:hypothetical protein